MPSNILAPDSELAKFVEFLRTTVAQVSTAPPDIEGFKKLEPVLRREFLSRADLAWLGPKRATRHGHHSSWLYWDPAISIGIGYANKGPVPIHNHGTWQFFGIYTGEIEYSTYHRADDAQTPGFAQLELVNTRTLRRGDFAFVEPPPHDIHGFTVTSDGAYVIGLVGHGGYENVRQYYVPDGDYYFERRQLED